MFALFAKIGRFKRSCEWLPIFITRVLTGLFLVFSGFFKLIDSEQHNAILQALTKANFSDPAFYAYFLPIIMILCGVLVTVGFLTSFSSLILFGLSLTSLIIINKVDSLIKYPGATLMENLFYLPEALYALIFLWLFFSGPGKLSLDHRYAFKKRKSSFSLNPKAH